MEPLIDIIIPTYNNPELLLSCLRSLKFTMVYPLHEMVRIIVVNNGNRGIRELISEPNIKIIEPGDNLGWEGGLKLGLEESKSKFVIFCNDDIRIITGSQDWFWKMMCLFNDPKVGAVGPSSNFVMGPQNIFADIGDTLLEVKYLIGFFLILRREALEKSGGVDDTLPGGDDIDLSIRLRDEGYKLLARKDVFVYHHGQATGTRVHAGYWNSPKMQEATDHALILKHGMKKYWETMVMGPYSFKPYDFVKYSNDAEGDICRRYVRGERILEVGCGGLKTDPRSVGVDREISGSSIPLVTPGQDKSVADFVDDVSVHLPVENGSQDTIIARHILEHCQDTLGTLSVWNRALKPGGRLIIAVPNAELGNTVVMNPEHIVSFSPSSLRNLAVVCGFTLAAMHENTNDTSLVAVFEKTHSPYPHIDRPRPTIHPISAGEIRRFLPA